MSLINEYINSGKGIVGLEKELRQLIARYNRKRNTYLLVYSIACGKPIPDARVVQEDYFIIHDLLHNCSQKGKSLDVYLETPGGSGETAEEIVEFLHSTFDPVTFVISGEAKSAGTIMALSGNEIMMTDTGSLGPIDAQMNIGRSWFSAYDYLEWVNEKHREAAEKGCLNPFDATMVAQITPGELRRVFNAQEFAKEKVAKWLTTYKFANWSETQTRKILVTENMKQEAADKITAGIADHSRWKSHGKSIKRQDLDALGLRVSRIEDDPDLADIVRRIQTVLRMLYMSGPHFKVFATEHEKIVRLAMVQGSPLIQGPPIKSVPAIEIEPQCNRCGLRHKLYVKFVKDSRIDEDFKKRGVLPFPQDSRMKCSCGAEIDVSGLKNLLEVQAGRRIII